MVLSVTPSKAAMAVPMQYTGGKRGRVVRVIVQLTSAGERSAEPLRSPVDSNPVARRYR